MMNQAETTINATVRLLFLGSSVLGLSFFGSAWMVGVIVVQAVQAELFSRTTAEFLVGLWVVAAVMLFVTAAVCSAFRSFGRTRYANAQPETGNERSQTHAFANLKIDAVADTFPLLGPMLVSGFLLMCALAFLSFLIEKEAISESMFRLLGYGLIATAWAGAITGSVWTILHPEAVTIHAEGENEA